MIDKQHNQMHGELQKQLIPYVCTCIPTHTHIHRESERGGEEEEGERFIHITKQLDI